MSVAMHLLDKYLGFKQPRANTILGQVRLGIPLGIITNSAVPVLKARALLLTASLLENMEATVLPQPMDTTIVEFGLYNTMP